MRTLTVLLVMLSSVCQAQFRISEHRTSLGFMFLAGAADGVRDAVIYNATRQLGQSLMYKVILK